MTSPRCYRRWSLAAAALTLLFAAAVMLKQNAPDDGRSWVAVDFMTFRDAAHEHWVFQDFTAHFNFCRQVWLGATDRPYTVAGHQALAQAWLGETPGGALIFGYAPPLFVLLAPLTPLPSAVAYALYTLATTTAVFALFYFILLPHAQGQRFQFFWLGLMVLSFAWNNTLQFGQTALLTTAAFAAAWSLLYQFSHAKWTASSWRRDTLLAGLLFALSAKPNLALILTLWLVVARAWRALSLASVGMMLACVLLAPRLGGWPLWWQDYLHVLLHYNPQDAGPFWSWSMNPANGTNLLQPLAFFHWCSPPLAARLCSLLWLASLIALTTLRLRERLSHVHFFQGHLLAFLLFSPNLMHTEDVVLVLLFLHTPLQHQDRDRYLVLALGLLAVNANCLYGLFSGTTLTLWPFAFTAKCILAFIVWSRTRPHATPAPVPS